MRKVSLSTKRADEHGEQEQTAREAVFPSGDVVSITGQWYAPPFSWLYRTLVNECTGGHQGTNVQNSPAQSLASLAPVLTAYRDTCSRSSLNLILLSRSVFIFNYVFACVGLCT